MSTPVPTSRPRPPSPIAAPPATRRAARIALALLAFAGAAFGPAAFAQSPPLSVLPATPRALQPTYARIELPGCRTVSAVRHAGGQFAIDVVSTLCGVPPPGRFGMEVSLGRLPQGDYRVRAYDGEAPGRPPLGPEVTFTVAAPVSGAFTDEYAPLVDLSGTWWNPARAGEGWFVDHASPDRMVVLWTMYDAGQQPVWLWMHGTRRSYGAISGPVYRVTGTPPGVTSTVVGQGEFAGSGHPFSGRSDRAFFLYTPTGQPTQRIDLERLSP